ncbi:hypothetical protein Tco_0613634 [Tanacetum coccineum]
MSTYLVNRSPSLAIRFKTHIDMLGFLGWLASIKQRMLEAVKVLQYQHSTHELLEYREDNNEVVFAVAVEEKIYAYDSLTFNDIVTCEVISKKRTTMAIPNRAGTFPTRKLLAEFLYKPDFIDRNSEKSYNLPS